MFRSKKKIQSVYLARATRAHVLKNIKGARNTMPHLHDSSVFARPAIGDGIRRTWFPWWLISSPDTESDLRARSLHHIRIRFNPSHRTRAPRRDPIDTFLESIGTFTLICSSLSAMPRPPCEADESGCNCLSGCICH